MGFERVCLMCVRVHVGVHAGEVMINIRAVKVSRGEAVDGKAPMTAKQTTQEKVVQNKTFQGHSFSIHDSIQAPRENGIMPAPVMAGILLMTLSSLQICGSMLCNVPTLVSVKDVT